ETAALMLDSPAPDVGELREILSDIRRDDQRAGEVIRRLRSLLKRTPFEAREIDLNETVRDVLDLVSALSHARGVSLDDVLTGSPLLVKADNIQLQQVVINLIVNAIDAMQPWTSRNAASRCAPHGIATLPRSKSPTTARASRTASSTRCSNRSIRPSPTAWAWDYPLRAPSSKCMAARSRRKTMQARVHCSGSGARWRPRPLGPSRHLDAKRPFRR